MKSIKKMFILSLLAFSLVATGCDLMGQIFDKPEETERDYTDSTGAQVHEEVTETKKEKVTEKKVTETDGTVIESTKTENYENDTTTYVEDTTAKDYTKHLESEAVMEPDETGIEKMTTTTESTQTFTDDSEGDIKEIKEHKVEKDGSNETGAVTDQTTTTTKKDGTVIEEKSYSEGRSGYKKTSKDVVDKDGKKVESESIEHKEIPSEKQDFDEDGIKVSSTEENVKITYDDQGKEATKVVSNYTNPGEGDFYNKLVKSEYTYKDGNWVLAKEVEINNMGGSREKTTVPQSDGTSKITIVYTDGVKVGEGIGEIDKDGTVTISSEFTNGAMEETIIDKDGNVTQGVYIPTFQGDTNRPCYIYTEAGKGGVTYKSCEILYDGEEEGDTSRNVIFKLEYTNKDGTKSFKVNRFGSELGVYRNVYIFVPDWRDSDVIKAGKIIYTKDSSYLRNIEAGYGVDGELDKFSLYYNDYDASINDWRWMDHFYEDDSTMDPEDLYFTPAEPPLEE